MFILGTGLLSLCLIAGVPGPSFSLTAGFPWLSLCPSFFAANTVGRDGAMDARSFLRPENKFRLEDKRRTATSALTDFYVRTSRDNKYTK